MIWLFVLGLITYFIVQSGQDPLALQFKALWLVAMMPAIFDHCLGTGVWDSATKIPLELVILLFVGCLALYLCAIQKESLLRLRRSDSTTSRVPSSTLRKSVNRLRADQQGRDEFTRLFSVVSLLFTGEILTIVHKPCCRGQLHLPLPEVKPRKRSKRGKFGDRFYKVFQEELNKKPFLCALIA
jgi:hypothetical protein